MPESGQSGTLRSTSACTTVRSIWFGMRCDFTREAIAAAQEDGSSAIPAVVVLPRSPGSAGTGWPAPPFDRWLAEHGIAVVEVERLSGPDLATVLGTIRERHIALGVGACFPMKVPHAVRAALEHGALNIHPSLLPQLRGPEPVFHAYRNGLDETGVTIHLMDDGWDSGPILAQQTAAISDDLSAPTLEAELARIGGRLLRSAAARWTGGALRAVPQREAHATWAPVPRGEVRRIPESLTVARARRFIDATVASFGHLEARNMDTGQWWYVSGVASPEHPDTMSTFDTGPIVRMRCHDGVILLRGDHARGAV